MNNKSFNQKENKQIEKLDGPKETKSLINMM